MNMQGGWLVALWIVGLVAASAATWAGCRWWYGRKLQAAAHRLHKSDKGRELSQQQTLQARRQIESLKAELEAHKKATADSLSSRQKTRQLEDALRVAEHAAESSAQRDSALMPLGRASAHGFADTQIMP